MDRATEIKSLVCFLLGIAGGFISTLVGGFTQSFKILILFMVLDYLTGLIVAGVFKNSNKTKSGALSSAAGFKGIAKKIIIFVYIIISYQVDKLLHANFVKDVVIVSFIINELISIAENTTLMGVPLPKALKKALDILEQKNNDDTDKIKK